MHSIISHDHVIDVLKRSVYILILEAVHMTRRSTFHQTLLRGKNTSHIMIVMSHRILTGNVELGNVELGNVEMGKVELGKVELDNNNSYNL